ncbi:hypothetical protein K7432_000789 [Basidiobolus ranarum]|uniref:DSBA-like thioredoxin domain-containing protein n=1 Tax=Basidiobolus ranarum TaxID=34480 RepID=A0ABR2X417_9FUNG
MAQSKILEIDVVSDNVCPWCFVGKRKLEKAIAQVRESDPEVQVEVRWHPYQLNPHQEGSVDKRSYYHSKFGKDSFEMMEARLRKVGENEGITFTQDGTLGNTLDSHRLVYFAQNKGKQDEAVEAIFKSYFEQGKNLADPSILIGIAEDIGLNKDEFQKYLLSGEGDDEVRSEVQKHRKYVNGVPHFTINQKYSLSGAQDPSEFLTAFRRAIPNIGKSSESAPQSKGSAQACSDGACAL